MKYRAVRPSPYTDLLVVIQVGNYHDNIFIEYITTIFILTSYSKIDLQKCQKCCRNEPGVFLQSLLIEEMIHSYLNIRPVECFKTLDAYFLFSYRNK